MDKDHHVAWADRVGLNKQWARDIMACGDSFGSPQYPTMVRRFRNNIPNIKNGPQFKNIINDYCSNELEKLKEVEYKNWTLKYPQKAQQNSFCRAKGNEIEYWGNEILYTYIIQLLEDNGFCFYESNIEEDEMK